MAKASEWALRVASWRASGLTSKEFCKSRGYSVGSLPWWSSQLGRKDPATAPRKESVRLARVVRPASALSGTPMILVELDGARVAVGRDASPAALRAVFEALRGRAGGGG